MKWDNVEYQVIDHVEIVETYIVVQFKNGDKATLPMNSIDTSKYKNIKWNELSYYDFEIVVPAEPNNIEISWSYIRLLQDKEYSAFVANKAEEQARQIGSLLKKIRTSKGIKSKDVAERAKITPQTISRIEQGKQDVSFMTLKRILAALGADLSDLIVGESEEKSSYKYADALNKLSDLGVPSEFIRKRLVPAALLEDIKSNVSGAINELIKLWSKIYNFNAENFWRLESLESFNTRSHKMLFKKMKNKNSEKLDAYLKYIKYIVNIINDTMILTEPVKYPDSEEEFMKSIKSLDLDYLINYIWSLGIPVIPLKDSGMFHAAAYMYKARPFIIIKQSSSHHSRWVFDLLHELMHVFAHLRDDTEDIFIDYEEPMSIVNSNQSSEKELEANAFAEYCIFRGEDVEDLIKQCVNLARRDVRKMKNSIIEISSQHNIRPEFLANYFAYRQQKIGEASWWGTANALQLTEPNPHRIALDILNVYVNYDNLSNYDKYILSKAFE